MVTFQGGKMTDRELLRRFHEMPNHQRERYQTLEEKKEYVEGVVRFELLAQEAVRQGLHRDSEVIDAAKKMMVHRLLEEEMKHVGSTVPEAQVEAYYQSHQSDFVRPATTRLAHIFFSTAQREAAAECLKEALKLSPSDEQGFAALAKNKSEDKKTREHGGDLGFLSDAELTSQLGAAITQAHPTLQRPGEVYPQLIETIAGFHIVRLVARQVELNLSIEKVKPQIQSQLINEARQQRYEALMERLKKQANIRIDANALGGLNIDVKAPPTVTQPSKPDFNSNPVHSHPHPHP